MRFHAIHMFGRRFLRCIEGFFLRTLEMHFNELLCRRDALQYCNVSGVERLIGVVSFVNKEKNRLFICGTITLIECQNDPTNYDSAIINQVWEPTIQACEWNNRTMRASHQSSKHGMEQLISNKSSIPPWNNRTIRAWEPSSNNSSMRTVNEWLYQIPQPSGLILT